jgi:predicted amidohydrolase YtcJ
MIANMKFLSNRHRLLVLPWLCLAALFSLGACRQTTDVDLLIYNATIYTVDSSFSRAQAIAIKENKIVAVGSNKDITDHYFSNNKIDAAGKFIYPGFIDAHAHFFNYSLTLQSANLVGSASWDEVLQRVQAFAAKKPQGWLLGRGWDQNRWPGKQFPSKEKLDQLFPDRPVFLTRVDGHAAIANQKALDLAGIRPGMTLTGGTIEVKDGRLTGMLIDNAKGLVSEKIPPPTGTEMRNALVEGQQNCFATGLTTVDDCGLDYREILFMDSLQQKGVLRMRVYAMLSDAPANYDFAARKGMIKTHRMDVRAFKVYADGALGSRGACLLEPYTDRPDWHGFLLSSQQHFDSVAAIIDHLGFQMCTHAIGDSGNRVMLNIYGKYLKGKNDRRWRIEHAQVVNGNDFSLFGQFSIVPSVQPTHATSDMYWAGERLGPERIKDAYAYKQLLQQNGWIPLGTDFPVEDISPFKTFYAAVFRKDQKGFPANGFQMENALTREQTLRGMTIWAARANFEEGEKGSLEPGKYADLVMLDKDIMTLGEKDFFTTQVQMTVLNGDIVYRKKP